MLDNFRNKLRNRTFFVDDRGVLQYSHWRKSLRPCYGCAFPENKNWNAEHTLHGILENKPLKLIKLLWGKQRWFCAPKWREFSTSSIQHVLVKNHNVFGVDDDDDCCCCWSYTLFMGCILLLSWFSVEKGQQFSKMTVLSCGRRLPNESCSGCTVVNSRAHSNAPSCLFESSYGAAHTFSWCTNTNASCCSWSLIYKISRKNKQLNCQAHHGW